MLIEQVPSSECHQSADRPPHTCVLAGMLDITTAIIEASYCDRAAAYTQLNGFTNFQTAGATQIRSWQIAKGRNNVIAPNLPLQCLQTGDGFGDESVRGFPKRFGVSS